MEKPFDQWNALKKRLNAKAHSSTVYYYEREIWWCSIGINIGVETDGKNATFERPVLILKKFNKDMFWAVPMTMKEHRSIHFQRITHDRGTSLACLSQLRSISSKRLLRKIGMVPMDEFLSLRRNIAAYIQKSDPVPDGVLGGRSP